jgi:DNA-binding NarL/FixJ family response regulator
MKSNSADDGSSGKTGARGERRRVKVLVVDDHTMFREGIAGMLTSSYGEEVEVVGKTSTGEDAVALAQEKDPDVITMQVDRTLMKARDTLKRIREGSSSSPPPKVIILTMFEDPLILQGILKLGANAYIHKSASVEELFAAVRMATLEPEGENAIVVVPKWALELSEDGWGKDGWGKDGSGSALSQRELEILLLLARGMSNQKIASRLSITEGTVKRHLANIYPKMGVAPGERPYA